MEDKKSVVLKGNIEETFETFEDDDTVIVEKIKKAIFSYQDKYIKAAEKFNEDYGNGNMGQKEYRDALDRFAEYGNYLQNLLIIKICMILGGN